MVKLVNLKGKTMLGLQLHYYSIPKLLNFIYG